MCQPRITRSAAAVVLALTLLTVGSASAGADVLQRGGETTGVAPASYRPCTDAVALKLQSDFAAFMQPDCPDAVRIEALRQLWRLLPPSELPESAAF